MKRTLCIALHDVAPATWPRCERLLAMLDGIGARAVTLLVVPDFHRGGAAVRGRKICEEDANEGGVEAAGEQKASSEARAR